MITDAPNHEKTAEGCNYGQAGTLSKWLDDSVFGDVWYPIHQNESSPFTADDHDFEDNALLPYMKGGHSYGT